MVKPETYCRSVKLTGKLMRPSANSDLLPCSDNETVCDSYFFDRLFISTTEEELLLLSNFPYRIFENVAIIPRPLCMQETACESG